MLIFTSSLGARIVHLRGVHKLRRLSGSVFRRGLTTPFPLDVKLKSDLPAGPPQGSKQPTLCRKSEQVLSSKRHKATPSKPGGIDHAMASRVQEVSLCRPGPHM